jgi:hypothetical protein
MRSVVIVLIVLLAIAAALVSAWSAPGEPCAAAEHHTAIVE